MKTPFVTKEQIDQICTQFPTPFHLYDEKGIRENARKLQKAFSWNKGYKEFFAVKATPNPKTPVESIPSLTMPRITGIRFRNMQPA